MHDIMVRDIVCIGRLYPILKSSDAEPLSSFINRHHFPGFIT